MRYSLVVPTRNGAATLPALLGALAHQRTDACLERLAIDSGSTDKTPALLARAGFAVGEVDPGEFAHGRSRNEALARARGELVFLFTQDVVPRGGDYLERLAGPLLADEQVAGAWAAQDPGPGASALARLRWRRSPVAGRRPRRVCLAGGEGFAAMGPAQRRALCEFHSAACCIRRRVWERHPFPDVPIAEDVAWAKEVLQAGYALAFEPAARVWHSHDRPFSQEYERIRAEAAQEWRLFAHAPVRRLWQVPLKALLWGGGDALALARQGRGAAREVPRALVFAGLRSVALHAGYRRGRGDVH